jgi:UDP-glucose 4-epimerase
VRHSRASAEKLLAAGWTPAHNLDSGLAETLAWYREQQQSPRQSSD